LKMSRLEVLAAVAALVVAVATLSVPVFANPSGPAYAQPIAFIGWPGPAVANGTDYNMTVGYVNQSPVVMNGTVVAVLHNLLGQTVEISTETFAGLGSGQNATATVAFYAPLDVYTVDVFVVSQYGWAMSAEVNATIVA